MDPQQTPDGWPQSDAAGQRLIDYLRVVRRRWWLVALVTALVTGGALAVSLTSTKLYDATAKLLLVQDEPVNRLLNPNAPAQSGDVERSINTKVELIKLDTVANQVRRELRLSESTDDLLSKVTTRVEGTSDIVGVTVRDTNPRRAARIANAFASSYVDFRRRSARRSIENAVELARNQLNSLSAEARQSEQGQRLQARLRELEIAATLQTGGVEIVRRATVPSDAARPRPLLSAALGLVLGLLVAVALALIVEFADRRLKDEEAVEEIYGLPILATIPRPPRRAQNLAPGEDSNQREAYGALATNLRFSSGAAESNVLMITSPGPEEGKTNVTLGVARALASLGQRVIAIEADLRRPAFARYGNFVRGGGLAEAIISERGLTESLTWIDPRTFEPVTAGGVRDETSFAVLPVAAVPTNPQRLLARPAMGQLLREARALAEFVLIDTAPVGTVNDAVTLTDHVDGVVIVSRLNRTTKDAARRTLRLLRHFDLALPGVVVTDAEMPREGYYYGPRADAEKAGTVGVPAS